MPDKSPILQLFESFVDVKALVVGDVMLDHYLYGQLNRISAEAPIPIVDIEGKEDRLGGAANVALNMHRMGANCVLASVIGDDSAGEIVYKLLEDNEMPMWGMMRNASRITTVKSRVFSNNRQVNRFDEEMRTPLSEQLELAFINLVENLIDRQEPNVVVLQDYNKGVMTENVITQIIKLCKEKEIAVAADPKFDNFFAYKGCTLFKPNLAEASKGVGMPIDPASTESLEKACNFIKGSLENQYTVITLADKGMYMHNEEAGELSPAFSHNIFDVSGAGDTVIAVLAMGLALNQNMYFFMDLANLAASQVCKQVGVEPVNLKRLYEAAEGMV